MGRNKKVTVLNSREEDFNEEVLFRKLCEVVVKPVDLHAHGDSRRSRFRAWLVDKAKHTPQDKAICIPLSLLEELGYGAVGASHTNDPTKAGNTRATALRNSLWYASKADGVRFRVFYRPGTGVYVYAR